MHILRIMMHMQVGTNVSISVYEHTYAFACKCVPKSIGVFGVIGRTYVCMSVCMYHIYPTPPLEQDMTQGQFLSGVLIQCFPSPRLVASPSPKNLVCPTIYP